MHYRFSFLELNTVGIVNTIVSFCWFFYIGFFLFWEEEQLSCLKQRVESEFPFGNGPDEICWKWDASVVFSSKSLYETRDKKMV